jgi:serine protease Do
MTNEHQSAKTPEFLRNRLLAAGSAAAIILLGLGAFGLWAHPGSDVSKPKTVAEQVIPASVQVPSRAQPPRMVEVGSPFSFADLVERVSPAVVTVTVEERVQEQQLADNQEGSVPDPFRDFFNRFGRGNRQFQQPQQPRKALATGSGFIIDKTGFIVTNNHVIENATKITVKLPDGHEFSAKLIGTDPATDVALVKINSDKPFPTVEFGDDKKVRVGDWVIAVGNPFGLSNTVTAGIVSSLGRNVGTGPYNDFIQIDAPINRGNSGGPTFDIEGHVIGMNSMIFSPTGGSVGIGFAIPASVIHDVVAQLKAHGKVTRGWLGVEIQSLTPEIAASLGEKETKGAIVATVVPGSPAAQAGFQPGDLVVALNGSGVEDSRSLTRRVAALQAGTSATFTIVREGEQKTLTAKIGTRKDDQIASNAPANNRQQGSANTGEAMGLGLAAVTPEVRRAYNLDDNVSGVLITRVDPDSDAADKGLQAGDIVVSIGNRTVHSPQEIKQRIAQAQAAGRNSVLMLVVGEGGQRFVAVKIGQG